MKKVKVAIFLRDIESKETIVDIDRLIVSDNWTHGELLLTARQEFSMCKHTLVEDVRVIDSVRISCKF